jgi:lipopolysaccharide transport protein LptA
MKLIRRFLCLAFLAAGASLACGQIPDAGTVVSPTGDSGASANAPGTTVIDSDDLHMDKGARTAIFTGNVVVTGTNMNMTCEEMTVFFTQDSKIDNIIAKGNVVIVQPGRITHCGQAQYFRADDKFILTDHPDILENTREIQAPKIILYRTQGTMSTEGRTKTTIKNSSGAAAAPGTPANTP